MAAVLHRGVASWTTPRSPSRSRTSRRGPRATSMGATRGASPCGGPSRRSLNAATVRIAQAVGPGPAVIGDGARPRAPRQRWRPGARGPPSAPPRSPRSSWPAPTCPLANGGRRFEATAVSAIHDADGQSLWAVRGRRHAGPLAGRGVPDDLAAGRAWCGRARRPASSNSPSAVAGKIGNHERRDETPGSSATPPNLVVLVWVGFDSGRAHGLSGTSGRAADLDGLHAAGARRPIPAAPFAAPGGRRGCATSIPTTGKLASESCPVRVREVFLAGTRAPGVPTSSAPEHAGAGRATGSSPCPTGSAARILGREFVDSRRRVGWGPLAAGPYLLRIAEAGHPSRSPSAGDPPATQRVPRGGPPPAGSRRMWRTGPGGGMVTRGAAGAPDTRPTRSRTHAPPIASEACCRPSSLRSPPISPPTPSASSRHCRWLLSQGVGLAVFGTNSEANSLSVDERIELLDRLDGGGPRPRAHDARDRLLRACPTPVRLDRSRREARLRRRADAPAVLLQGGER